MEHGFEVSWDVLEERENPARGVLVAEGVEYEAFLGDERVSIGWSPILG
jgi:hypothetical protein